MNIKFGYSFFLLYFLGLQLLAGALHTSTADVRISEIMRDPLGNESVIGGGKSNEFVEFTNFGPETLALGNLFISNGITVDSIIPFAAFTTECTSCKCTATILAPGHAALIFDKEYLSDQNAYRYSLDTNATILTVNHIDLLGGITANDGLFIYRGTRSSIDSVICTALDSGIAPTFQNTKLPLHARVASREGTSLVPDFFILPTKNYFPEKTKTSAGYIDNTKGILRFEYQCLDTIQNTVLCSLGVRRFNGGPLNTVRVTGTSENSTVFLVDTTLESPAYGTLFFCMRLPLGINTYILTTHSIRDSASLFISIAEFAQSLPKICITTLSPRATATSPEWVECFNSGTFSSNLKNWTIGSQSVNVPITQTDYILEAKSYCILTPNTSLLRAAFPGIPFQCIEVANWPTLDNYHDTIIIANTRHQTITTAHYTYLWYSNWNFQSLTRTCVACTLSDSVAFMLAEHRTPGVPEARLPYASVTFSMSVGPTPFTPNKDRIDDLLAIKLLLPPLKTATITIRSMRGDNIKQFTQCASGTLFWDGRSSSGSLAPLGPFFVLAQRDDQPTASPLRAKGLLWR